MALACRFGRGQVAALLEIPAAEGLKDVRAGHQVS